MFGWFLALALMIVSSVIAVLTSIAVPVVELYQAMGTDPAQVEVFAHHVPLLRVMLFTLPLITNTAMFVLLFKVRPQMIR